MNRFWQDMVIAFSTFALFVSVSTATAAPTGAADFNHSSTGFPLTGGHATAVCETCHVGGVFKGTPRDCEGCHALGKRVVATPKSTSHVVTDAPCDSCHFNTATFLGARYNHSLSRPESCTTCHNGRIAQGRPANHISPNQATKSCDSCHRTSAFLPSSWNHTGVLPGSCTDPGCHGSGAPGKPDSHTTIPKATFKCDDCHGFVGWLPGKFKHNHPGASCVSCHDSVNAPGKTGSHTRTGMLTYNCDDCHASVVSWLPAIYKHTAASSNGRCDGCHNNAIAASTPPGHIAIGTDDCGQCHTSTATWLGALGGKPANHIPYNSVVTCSACHTGNSVATGATLHENKVSSTCKTCHNSSPVYLGSMRRVTLGNHHKSTTSQDCTSCHAKQYNNWNEP